MFYREYKPSESLKRFIKCFWIMEREYSSESFLGDTEYLWPSGLTEVLHVKGPSFTYIDKPEEIALANDIVIGAFNKRFVLKNKGNVRIVGIRCYNHGAHILFDIDLNKIKNCIEDFDLKDANKAVLDSSNKEEIIQYLNLYCEALVKVKEEELAEVLYRLYKETDLSIAQLADEANLSIRQFERKVKSMTGFAPKELIKIVRFDKARVKLLFNEDYLQVMSDLGYYDYSHFCRDFKRFYEITPKQFVDMFNRNR